MRTGVLPWPDADMLAKARRFKPIPVPAYGPTRQVAGGWKDAARDAWGAPRRKGLSWQWMGGQCLQACVASVLGIAASRVPNPEISYAAKDDWHSHYSERLAKAVGYRLEFLAASACPPKHPGATWIAGLREPDDLEGHAVCARGAFVLHDPSGLYLGRLPLDRVVGGMILRPTHREVLAYSPAGSRRMVVSA